LSCFEFRVSADLHLAILHPRSLVVYKIFVSEGAVDHGYQYKLEKIYQHKLERTAANMVIGPFGQIQSNYYPLFFLFSFLIIFSCAIGYFL